MSGEEKISLLLPDRSIHRSISVVPFPRYLKNQGISALKQRTLTPSFQGSNPCSPASKTRWNFPPGFFFVRKQVINPLHFYDNKNLDVDEVTGFSYSISIVDAEPGEQAREYVKRSSKLQLDAELKQKARELSFAFTNIYEEAIMTEVAEGKLSEEEAILKIREYKDASDFIKEAMAKADFHILTGQPEANLADGKQAALGAFYFISVCFLDNIRPGDTVDFIVASFFGKDSVPSFLSAA